MSYAKEDRNAVRRIYARLKEDRFSVWLDEHNLLPGHEWETEIKEAIANADAIVVCLSRSAVTKRGYVQKEINYALDEAERLPERSIFIIPARLGPCDLPRRLAKWQCVDLFSKSGPREGYGDLRVALLSCHTAKCFASISLPSVVYALDRFAEAVQQLPKGTSEIQMLCCELSRHLWFEVHSAITWREFADHQLTTQILQTFDSCLQLFQELPNEPISEMIRQSIQRRREFLQKMIEEGPEGVSQMMQAIAAGL